MRKHIVAANWKMNKTFQEGMALIEDVYKTLDEYKPNCEVLICPPSYFLGAIDKKYCDKLTFGAQDCSEHTSGAYTGEISAPMIASTVAKAVIIGHSERRAYHNEGSEMLAKKVDQALEAGLRPVFCVGEKLDQREDGTYMEVVAKQVKDALFHLSDKDFAKIILAYEPVWAIGTGKTASADQAQEMHANIRKVVAEKYGQEIADNCTILYGGSCKGENAPELFAKPDVDGGLIGGASLEASKFLPIIKAFDK